MMMSSGVKGAAVGSRVSIPSSVKKTIEDIKEITGHNHSEDEIYAMLKECSMDPNETTQKLLLLGTFHEVKKKRDRRKETMTGFKLLSVHVQNLNKEPAESRWKPGSQAQGNRAGRGNYSSRNVSQDAGGGRSSYTVKERATSQILEKVVSKSPLVNAQELKKNEASSIARWDSPISDVSKGPSGITSQSTNSICDNHMSASGGVDQYNETGITSMHKLEGPLTFSSPIHSSSILDTPGTRDIQKNEKLDSNKPAKSPPPAPGSVSHFSSLDLVPSVDSALPSAMGAISGEAGNQQIAIELIADNLAERKSASAMQEKMPNDFQGVGNTQNSVSMGTASSTFGVSSVSRPSSNYNNPSQVVGPQKVVPSKEWKPKSTNPSIGQSGSAAASSEVSTISVGTYPEPHPDPSKEATPELQRKLEELHISDSQHVSIPNQIHVPEVGKLGFCFGSFDASFGVDMAHNGGLESDKSPALYGSSEPIDEPVKELKLRCLSLPSPSSVFSGFCLKDLSFAAKNQTVLVAMENSEAKYPGHTQSVSQGPEIFLSSEFEVPSSINPDYGESKQEVAPKIHQHPVVHSSSNYNIGFMQPILSGQLPPFESSESQTRDVPQLPSFAVQQSFDPTSYYAQFYLSGMDSDGRTLPLQSAGAENKYNGNAALVSAQTSQEVQVGAPLIQSMVSSAPLVTQAAGIMQSSIAATQQPLPVLHQPTGVHLPHYPPFIAYGPYFSPFYVPPPAIHQFLSNGASSQQPQGGSLYPTPPGTIAKYSVSQYKQGSSSGSSSHVRVAGSYGSYGLSAPNYTPSSATPVLTSTFNEDIAASQAKENYISVSGQQKGLADTKKNLIFMHFTNFASSYVLNHFDIGLARVKVQVFPRVNWLSPQHSPFTEPLLKTMFCQIASDSAEPSRFSSISKFGTAKQLRHDAYLGESVMFRRAKSNDSDSIIAREYQ
ncbi:GBF-interacting protein 1 [Sesamum angolense]|uniref:GBF-interacting protein 1 n=1 Tax=Sesamum angolense TaxID=2727404 RepID=A0AAE2BI60_9LAMI|nr:GBF-interacting protein 1 [Sesamum angolense]